MEKIRVLVVDDSAFMRKMISDILEKDHRLTVVGTARNGQDGIKKIEKFSPDVVTLDVEMPIMDGLSALQHIMKNHPLPVVMLSSLTKEGAESTVKAMELGAVDFISKPSGPISLDIDKIQDKIVTTVLHAAKANLKEVTKHIDSTPQILPLPIKRTRTSSRQLKKIVAIGTSTGGPRALQQVLTKLPKDFPVPIVVVQHMPKGFTKSLADRLNSISEIQVKEAEDGEILQKGCAYIAPGDYHLKVKKVGMALAVQLDQSEAQNGHRPSVDVMFDSLSEQTNYFKIAVVMTGMGTDGAKGLVNLKSEHSQSIVIAESEESAIVYGMPKAAVKTNKVDHVVNVNDISHTILQVMGGEGMNGNGYE